MMKPTVGRVVYFNEGTKDEPRLLASIVVKVHDIEDLVNLRVFDDMGGASPRLNVSRGSESDQWDWMPYQKQKAAAGDNNSESAEPRPE